MSTSKLRLDRTIGEAAASGFGLEIGPLNAPLLKKPDHQVQYVDYAPTAVLRRNQFDPSIDPDQIVEVDIVWGERRLREAVGRTVDFVVASHVVEHVPDLVGWLFELREVLEPGGVLGLVVPDKRFTFDALRTESTIAEAVEAYLLGYRQPSLRQVFDAAALGVAVDAASVWRDGPSGIGDRRAEVLERLPRALDLVRRLHHAPRYNDAHCWVFSPASFLALLEELAAVGLLPFTVDAFWPTEPGSFEFYVRFIADDPENADAILASLRDAMKLVEAEKPKKPSELPDADTGEPAATVSLQMQIEQLRGENQALLESTCWRVTAPLRWASRLRAKIIR